MTFEEYLSWVNQNAFFYEFTFSRTRFCPQPGDEVELADNIVLLNDSLLIFQAKERTTSLFHSDLDTERNWFRSKVVNKGTRQIRDTLSYLEINQPIRAINQRDHEFEIMQGPGPTIKVVAYDNRMLSGRSDTSRWHLSRTAGVIHIVSKEDYSLIIRTLFTPAEVKEYFRFREEFVQKYFDPPQAPKEEEILGQYLSGELDAAPNIRYTEYLDRLDNDTTGFDLGTILLNFGDRIYDLNPDNPTDYYPILREFAKLTRTGLGLLKERFEYCLRHVWKDTHALPTRVYSHETECGFVLMPVTRAELAGRRRYLFNITAAAKYAGKMHRQIGICFGLEDGEVLIDWCYNEGENQPNPELDRLLAESNPFRPVSGRKLSRYVFD